jgi:hypothetical protein
MTLVLRKLLSGRSVWLATFLLPFVGLLGLYGMNWLILHQEFVTVFHPHEGLTHI